jgi:hypothetical protein
MATTSPILVADAFSNTVEEDAPDRVDLAAEPGSSSYLIESWKGKE